jgi:hypothetical protein
MMPDTSPKLNFSESADIMDTSVGTAKKDDAADVAKVGFDAMMRGDGDIVTGFRNQVQSAVANVTPPPCLQSSVAKWLSRGPRNRNCAVGSNFASYRRAG